MSRKQSKPGKRSADWRNGERVGKNQGRGKPKARSDAGEFETKLNHMSPRGLAQFLVKHEDTHAAEFIAFYGEERFKRLRNLAIRLRDPLRKTLRSRRVKGTHWPEHVVIVPDFLGSELQVVRDTGARYTAWPPSRGLSPRTLRDLQLRADGRTPQVRGVSVAEMGLLHRYYDELSLTILEHCEVHHFAYDWRRDILALAALLDSFLKLKFGSGGNRKRDSPAPEREPRIALVTHGLGSLVALAMIARRNERAEPGERPRLVMLGLPHARRGLMGGTSDAGGVFGEGILERASGFLDDGIREPTEIRGPLVKSLASFPSLFQLLRGEGGHFISDEDLLAVTQKPERNTEDKATVHAPPVDQRSERLTELETLLTTQLKSESRNERVLVDRPGRDANERCDWWSLLSELSDQNATDGRTAQEKLVKLVTADVLPGGHLENRRILASLDELLEGRGLEDQIQDEAVRAGHRDHEITSLDRLVENWLTPGRGWKGPPTGSGEMTQQNTHHGPSQAHESDDTGAKGCASPSDDTVEGNSTGIKGPKLSVAVADIGELRRDFEAIAVGHYEGVLPEGSELAVDLALSERFEAKRLGEPPGSGSKHAVAPNRLLLSQITSRGLFRGELGRLYLLPNPDQPDQTICLVGMGEIGNFGMPELTIIVQQLMWHLCYMGKKNLCTVLIGSGSEVLPDKAAARAWTTGIQMAWRRLHELGTFNPSLETIQFCARSEQSAREIYDALDSCDLVLKKGEQKPTRVSNPVWIELKPLVKTSGSNGGGSNEKSASKSSSGREPQTRMTIDRVIRPDGYRFALLTQQASIPERVVPLDGRLIDEACRDLILQRKLDSQLDAGRLLCRLILPREFRVKLQNSGRLMLGVDAQSARIPWEMLTTITGPLNDLSEASASHSFLAVGRSMVRQFVNSIAPAASPAVEPGSKVRILVVADPAARRPLKGAREEAVMLRDLFDRFNAEMRRHKRRLEVEYKLLIGPREARRIEVIRELTREQYDVLHFAGHCSHDPQDASRSGWVFGVDDQGREELLTAREIDRIDKVPAFVFSNSCESGISPTSLEDRDPGLCPAFAQAFFKQGVQNFLGTGWPVSDRSARLFAHVLYGRMLGFSEADLGLSTTTANKNRTADQSARVSQQRSPVADALRDAREMLIREAELADPSSTGPTGNLADETHTSGEVPSPLEAVEHLQTWGAYQFYGNPEFQLLADRDELSETSTEGKAASDDAGTKQKRERANPAVPVAAPPTARVRPRTATRRADSREIPAADAGSAALQNRLAGILAGDTGGTRSGSSSGSLAAGDAERLAERTVEELRRQSRVLNELRGGKRRSTRNLDKAWKTLEETCRKGCEAVREERLAVLEDSDLGRGVNLTLALNGERPAFLVLNDEIVWETGTTPSSNWKDRIKALDQSRLKKLLGAVGMIRGAKTPPAGTGFLIAENLVMTNRHVLQDFYFPEERNGKSTGVWRSRTKVSIRFGEEFGQSDAHKKNLSREIKQVVFAPPEAIDDKATLPTQWLPDVAILELDEPKVDRESQPEPLPLKKLASESSGGEILVVGHPFKDPRYQDGSEVSKALMVVYGDRFGVKQAAPGTFKVQPNDRTEAREGLRDQVTRRLIHNATTLGGNSGSPLLGLQQDLACLGLHYGGQLARNSEDETNWAQDFEALMKVSNTVRGQPPTLGEFLKSAGLLG